MEGCGQILFLKELSINYKTPKILMLLLNHITRNKSRTFSVLVFLWLLSHSSKQIDKNINSIKNAPGFHKETKYYISIYFSTNI